MNNLITYLAISLDFLHFRLAIIDEEAEDSAESSTDEEEESVGEEERWSSGHKHVLDLSVLRNGGNIIKIRSDTLEKYNSKRRSGFN